MAMRSRDRCKEIASELEGKESMFVLGKGYGEPIAMEGALKIKEMTYMHAEGYSGGALKHGPFALIEGQVLFPPLHILHTLKCLITIFVSGGPIWTNPCRLSCP